MPPATLKDLMLFFGVFLEKARKHLLEVSRNTSAGGTYIGIYKQ